MATSTATNTTSEYSVWKKNCPLLYSQLQTSSLLWPSLSIDWLPDASVPNKDQPVSQNRLLLSTYSDGINQYESLLVTSTNIVDLTAPQCLNLQNFDYSQLNNEFIYSLPLQTHLRNTKDLLVQTAPVVNSEDLAAALATPIDNLESQSSTLGTSSQKEGSDHSPKVNNSLGLLQRIPHAGDINRIKHCPQNPDLIATTSQTGTVRVFDRTKKPNTFDIHATIAEPDTSADPSSYNNGNTVSSYEVSDIILDYHTSESWTIDWNPHKYATIASASNDGSIAVWDLQSQFKAPPKKKLSLQSNSNITNSCKLSTPDKNIPAHDYGVNEIRWIPDHDSLILSVGEDSTSKLWDIRLPNNASMIKSMSVEGNSDPLNTVDVSPFQTFQFVTGTGSGHIHIFDIRSPNQPLMSNTTAHKEAITATKYSPHLAHTFASASNDATVAVWKPTGEQPSVETTNPVFVHRGHLLAVNDLSWCPSTPNTIASCANDNSVHLWQPVLPQ